MRLLLDTHFLIWLACEPGEIRRFERAVIADPKTDLVASVISIWELRIKWNLRDSQGLRKGKLSPEDAIVLTEERGIELASLHPQDCVSPLDPPLLHRDPFDEMLLAHAGRLDARLLTRDSRLLDHPLVLQL